MKTLVVIIVDALIIEDTQSDHHCVIQSLPCYRHFHCNHDDDDNYDHNINILCLLNNWNNRLETNCDLCVDTIQPIHSNDDNNSDDNNHQDDHDDHHHKPHQQMERTIGNKLRHSKVVAAKLRGAVARGRRFISGR